MLSHLSCVKQKYLLVMIKGDTEGKALKGNAEQRECALSRYCYPDSPHVQGARK